MTNTDKTVAERLAVADALEEFAMIDECEGGNPLVIATERRAAELLREASRTQEPAGWLEKTLTDHAAKHGPLFIEDIEDIFSTLRAASITPPAPERSKEEGGQCTICSGTGIWARGIDDVACHACTGTGKAALEPASLHKGEAVAWLHVLHKEQGETEEVVSVEMSHEDVFGVRGRDYDPSFRATSTPLYASPAPLPVGEEEALLALIREEAGKDNSPLGRSDSLAIRRIRTALGLDPHSGAALSSKGA